MRLTVDHVTRYSYEHPVTSLVQSHRLTPSVYEGQRTLSWEVTVSEGRRGAEFTDGGGDRIQGWSVPGPVHEVTVHVRGELETIDTAGVLRGHREVARPALYLRETPITAASAGLRSLASAPQGDSALDLAHAMSRAVTAAIAYRPGVTHAHTTAAEALEIGEGVCQDHAHALIAAARLRGLPARYVSGYLFADANGEAHEAAHAWAEIYIEGLGWVGFDAANACCPDERYIRLGSGFDAGDAAPIRGVARGGFQGIGEETLDVAVAILAAGQ